MRNVRVVAVTACVMIAACAKQADRADTTSTKADTGGMASMPGMMSPAVMDSMAAHLRGMDTASVATLQAMLPIHRQMAANMLSQMDSDMRNMNTTADARWTALADSVRQDLVRLPDMTAQQLKAAMAAHQGRVTRLMTLHRDMMKM